MFFSAKEALQVAFCNVLNLSFVLDRCSSGKSCNFFLFSFLKGNKFHDIFSLFLYFAFQMKNNGKKF